MIYSNKMRMLFNNMFTRDQALH